MGSGENNEMEVGTLENPSATGTNPDIPEFSDKNLNRHFGSGLGSDHSGQYPGFTKEQYAQRAIELARKPVCNGIKGYKSTKGKYTGSIVRYDMLTNDWVRAYPTSGVAIQCLNQKKMLGILSLSPILRRRISKWKSTTALFAKMR